MTDPVHHGEAERWGGWQWSEPRHGEHFRRCSYCGSVHPGDLAAEPTWRAEWADRKYGWPHKFYVKIPNRSPDALFVVSSTHDAAEGPYAPGGEFWSPPKPGMIAWADLTPEQLAIVERDGPREASHVSFGTRNNHFGKFYSVHLADPAISDEVKETIQQRSGIRFRFDGGTVSWRSAAYPL